MKFSILGFDQNGVLSLSKNVLDRNGKEKTIQLDVTDLLIVRELADFMNRKKIIKYTFDDKTFFSIKYSAIIEDLPILNIKKQALSDRIDKIATLGVLEKKVVRDSNGTFTLFRIGDKYEELIYSPTSSEIQGGSYSTTNGVVSNYEPKNNTTNTITTKTINKEEGKPSKKAKIDWRGDYEVYKNECEKAIDEIYKDKQCESNLRRRYPNMDYYRTILKSVAFWESEKGWEYKKKSRATNIYMATTIKKNLDKNIEYENPKNQPIENETLLKLKIVDEEGYLEDGTIFKGGHRYYWSEKESKTISIPVDEVARPDDRFEYDMKKGWYLPEEKETIDDLLW